MSKNYDSIMVFDRPITLKDEDGLDWTAYGCVYDSRRCFLDEYEYVRYLVGLEEWYAQGNISNTDKSWTDNSTGITYKETDDYIKDFCHIAYCDNPVSFFCKRDITFSIPKDCVEDSFIVCENYWKVAIDMILDMNAAEKKAQKKGTIDCLVVFSHSEKLPGIDKPVYGIGFNSEEYNQENIESDIQSYIEFLCAVRKWMLEDGCSIDYKDTNIWTDRDGTTRKFSLDDEFFKNYIAEAYAKRPIDYMIVYNCDMSFNDGEITENHFITKNIRALWKRKY